MLERPKRAKTSTHLNGSSTGGAGTSTMVEHTSVRIGVFESHPAPKTQQEKEGGDLDSSNE